MTISFTNQCRSGPGGARGNFSSIRRAHRYSAIVAEFDRAAYREDAEFLTTVAFCKEAAISPRTLLRAFQAARRISPCRYLRTVRLAQAREALLLSSGGPGTVTEIAMRFGFLELGRFATLYRKTYGECPSATLRRNTLQSCIGMPKKSFEIRLRA